jgi:hypothetical protein
MKKIIAAAIFAITLALTVIPAKADIVTLNGAQYTQATNSAGQVILTPVAAPVVAVASQPIPTPQSFLTTVEGYFTSFNTNLTTFGTNAPYEAWAGVAYQAGLRLGANLALEAKPFSGAPGFMIGSVSTLADTVGTIAQQEVDVGWSIVHYDVELTAGGAALYTFQDGYDKNGKGMNGGVFVEAKKALTENTFAGIRAEEVFGSGRANQPILTLFGGFTF